MSTNTQLSDIEKAKEWVNTLGCQQIIDLGNKYYPASFNLTATHWIEIWRKETQQSTPEGEEGLQTELYNALEAIVKWHELHNHISFIEPEHLSKAREALKKANPKLP